MQRLVDELQSSVGLILPVYVVCGCSALAWWYIGATHACVSSIAIGSGFVVGVLCRGLSSPRGGV